MSRSAAEVAASVERMVGGILRKDDRVLLCLRSREREHCPGVWDVPGGHVEAHESLEQALLRELHEELGIEARLPGGGPWGTARLHGVELHLFVVDAWDGALRNCAAHEHEEIRWVSLDELPQLALAHPLSLELLRRALRRDSSCGTVTLSPMSSPYWSDLANGLTPYTPGEQPQTGRVLKLNTNENPYPPSPRAAAELVQDLARTLGRYPDPRAETLRAAAARRHGLSPENVFAANGSDEVLAFCFMAFFKGRGTLRFPDVSYSFYAVWSQLFDIEVERIPLAPDFSLDLAPYRAGRGGIVFPNPNAPTGMAAARDAIARLLAARPDDVVVVDEAYVEFGAESAVPLLSRFPNLVVVQTLSKSHALAGLRVGFALAQPELIAGLDRVKSAFNSYPIDRIAQRVAIAALEDEAYFASRRDQILATRTRTTATLAGLGFEVLPSSANFLFARHPRVAAADLFAGLRAREILVRHFDSPRTRDFLRVTVGTDDEMSALIAALQELLSRP